MPKHLHYYAMTLLLAATAAAQSAPDKPALGIVAVRENGRTVYVNDDSPRQPAAEPARPAAPRSTLAYWSRTENRWVPVPAPTPWAMRAARSAAYEVSRYVAAQPRARTSAAAKDPNYDRIARGRAVTAAELDKVIDEVAARHGVDPNLVRAIIKVESNFNPAAVSRSGAMGLMQLMPDTARQLGISNAFDPKQNVDGGVRHLRTLLNNYRGDLTLTLAAYNAGEGAVNRSNGIPRNGETQNYVKKITDLYGGGKPGTRLVLTPKAPIRVFRRGDGVLTVTNE